MHKTNSVSWHDLKQHVWFMIMSVGVGQFETQKDGQVPNTSLALSSGTNACMRALAEHVALWPADLCTQCVPEHLISMICCSPASKLWRLQLKPIKTQALIIAEFLTC